MYIPRHFEEPQPEALHGFIREYPLGALVVNGPGGLDANHLPFELDAVGGERGRLLAHVARANPLWKEAKDGGDVLVIFRGDNAYVSPNWYPTKRETDRHVPTWNYQAVHVHGMIAIRDDERFVRGLVARLTRMHEAATGSEKPWRMTDSSKEYIDRMLTMIVGIEIEIVSMTGKWKLSQNREDRDRLGVAEELRLRGEGALSAAMLNVV